MYQVDEPIHVIAYVNVMILNYSFVTYFAPSMCTLIIILHDYVSLVQIKFSFVYLYVYSVASEVTSDA